MASLDTSAADFMFKKLYADGLDKDCLLRGKQLLQWMSHETDFTTHKGKEIPVPYTGPQGIGATNADAVASATPSGGKSFVAPQRHVTAYGQIDGDVVRNAIHGDAESAFADAMEREVDGTTESLGSELNQRAYGASDGVRSFIKAASAVNTTTLHLARPEEAQLYEIGMRLQFINPADGTLRTGGTGYVVIEAVDPILGTCTLTGTLNAEVTSVVAGDGIVRKSMNTKDLDGVKGWCPATMSGSDSFLGVNRSVYRTRLAGIYLDKSDITVRSGLMTAIGTAKTQVGRHLEKKSPIFINPMKMMEIRLVVEAARIVEGTMEDDYGIGIEKIEVLGNTFIEDSQAPADEAIFIGKGAFTRGSCGDQPYIDDCDGSKFWYNRQTGKLEFTLCHDGNTYSYKPYNIMRVKIGAAA